MVRSRADEQERRNRQSVVVLLYLVLAMPGALRRAAAFEVVEAAISDVQLAFQKGQLTSVQLVEEYLRRIAKYDDELNSIIEINPDVLLLAEKADIERAACAAGGDEKSLGGLHGVPVLLKDNIGTVDKLNTTAGSFAPLGSTVTKEAFIVKLLRAAGAIILGKANLSEFAHFRSLKQPDGFSPRGGQTKDPYNLTLSPGGSSSGSAVATAANLVLLAIGTETEGSIVIPTSRNSVASLKPTPGLTSRVGLIPISFQFDSPGPIGKYVEDVVALLDVIAVPDPEDPLFKACSRPAEGYEAHKLLDGIQGKRIGIARNFFQAVPGFQQAALDSFVAILSKQGATVVENANINPAVLYQILQGADPFKAPITADKFVLLSDFKVNIDNYLLTLKNTELRTLADIIAFDQLDARQQFEKFPDDVFIGAQNLTSGQNSQLYLLAQRIVAQQNRDGLLKLFQDNKLDALLAPAESDAFLVAALAGFPIFTLPAGFNPSNGLPFGVSLLGTPCQEAKLIEIAFPLEGLTRIRQTPPGFA